MVYIYIFPSFQLTSFYLRVHLTYMLVRLLFFFIIFYKQAKPATVPEESIVEIFYLCWIFFLIIYLLLEDRKHRKNIIF